MRSMDNDYLKLMRKLHAPGGGGGTKKNTVDADGVGDKDDEEDESSPGGLC